MSKPVGILNPKLVALKPRQVLLSQHNMKQRNAAEASNFSAVLKPEAVALEPEQRTLLHHAVALYLESNGFSKTLKKFRSEAQIEKDTTKGFVLNLEEICYKYLNKCNQANPTRSKQGTTKEVADDRVSESQEEPTQKNKNKKTMKTNVVSKLNVDSVEKEQPHVCEEVGKKSKDKKKKKDKRKLESIGNDLENGGLEINHIAVAKNSEDTNVSKDSEALNTITLSGNIVPHEEKAVEAKTKKKKDRRHLSNENLKQLLTGSLNATVNENDGIKMARENDYHENSKKRKRLTVVEGDSHPVDDKQTEDIKRRKLEGSKGCNDDVQSTKVNALVETDVNSESRVASNQHDESMNVSVEKTGEKASTKRAMKKQSNGSAEPKTVNAFQRVKIDDVVFVDERLADNSYWSKGGAEIGYGAKAQEILGQVKGRDFRHEKTKKKRGTYRGGVIDLQSHSVKFNYSDDD